MTAATFRRHAAFGVALTLLSAAPAFAQAAAAPQQPPTRTQLSAELDSEFKDIDTNHDGKLTKAEVQGAIQKQLNGQAKEVFDKLDTNHNGQISLAEFEAQGSVDTAKVAARVQQLDANHDGVVSQEEYRNATLAEFDKVDTNHDGVISAAEAQAAGGGSAPSQPQGR